MDKEKYQLRYITLPKEFYSDNRLNATELRVLAFIYSYAGDKFYFGNENMAEMFNVSERSITSAINSLREYGYIDTKYDISAGGGKIRYITRLAEVFSSELKKSSSQNGRVLLHKDNKKKENKKKEREHTKVTKEYIQELQEKYSKIDVSFEWEKARDWKAARGKSYKDERAFFRNWLRRAKSFGNVRPAPIKNPSVLYESISDEQRLRGRSVIEDAKRKLGLGNSTPFRAKQI